MNYRLKVGSTLLVLSLAVVLLAGFGAGLRFGERSASQRAEIESKTHAERDAKILAVIVKRNPNATIKEFSGFPAFLVEESQRHGLDYRYVMALIDKESEWNPRAVSAVGATGLMQLMPATAKLVVDRAKIQGYEPPGKGLLGSLGEPRFNVQIGTQYLKWKIDEYGLGPEHLRAYNAGDRLERAAPQYAEDVALRFVRLAAAVPR